MHTSEFNIISNTSQDYKLKVKVGLEVITPLNNGHSNGLSIQIERIVVLGYSRT